MFSRQSAAENQHNRATDPSTDFACRINLIAALVDSATWHKQGRIRWTTAVFRGFHPKFLSKDSKLCFKQLLLQNHLFLVHECYFFLPVGSCLTTCKNTLSRLVFIWISTMKMEELHRSRLKKRATETTWCRTAFKDRTCCWLSEDLKKLLQTNSPSWSGLLNAVSKSM